MTGKRWGRIGDSPIIGAGTYADDRACAVSATGYGEYFIRVGVAHEICARMRLGGASGQQAADAVMGEVKALGGSGGVIVVTPKGEMVYSFNTPGMYRGKAEQRRPQRRRSMPKKTSDRAGRRAAAPSRPRSPRAPAPDNRRSRRGSRVRDEVRRPGDHRLIAARQLVLALRARLHRRQPVRDRPFDRLVIAQLEVEEAAPRRSSPNSGRRARRGRSR